MEPKELRARIAGLKREKKAEEERRGLRRGEREAIAETREAKRERRIAGVGLAVEKAKVYKALPLPHIRPRDEEERVRQAELRAKKAEAEARRQIALSKRRREVAETKTATTKAEAEARVAEREAKKTRLLTERELRAERLKPYTRAATKTAKVIGAVGVEVGKGVIETGKLAVKGLQKLGEAGMKPRPPARREQPLDFGIDLGLGGPAPARKPRKPEKPYREPPLDLSIRL